jgi:uncharacterized membrane protein YphA (DoxX/SURF4 family)
MKAWTRALDIVLRAGVGSLFAYAGASKIESPQAFADAIHAYQVLPAVLIYPVALALPFFELLVGGSLLIGWRLRETALAAVLMAAVFLAAIVQAQIRGFNIDCGCFGPDAWAVLKAVPAPLRDGLLLAASLFLWWKRWD